jgi:hypothetical protein
LVGGDVVEGGLEESGDVGAGGCAAKGGECAEGGGVFEGLGGEGGAVDEDKAGAGAVGFVDGIGEVGEACGAFGEASGEVLLLHAGAAVDEEEDGIRCAAGEAEEAAGEGATGHEDEGGESEDAEGEDEVLTEFGEALVHALGGAEEHGGGPADGAAAMQVDQVDDDREEREGERDEEEGLEETHLI